MMKAFLPVKNGDGPMKPENADTTMSEAFSAAGMPRPETPQKAAERIWGETKRDPVETMKRFDEWAREDAARMLAVVGDYWPRLVRAFLGRPNAWAKASSFGVALHKRAIKAATIGPAVHVGKDRGGAARMRRLHQRRKAGIKIVTAEVDVKTGAVNLIDKEVGPFAHIRINGLRLAEATTEQALHYCDSKTQDLKFIRALCRLIPDPRRPIGEQWTPEIIREAKETARGVNE